MTLVLASKGDATNGSFSVKYLMVRKTSIHCRIYEKMRCLFEGGAFSVKALINNTFSGTAPYEHPYNATISLSCSLYLTFLRAWSR